MSEILNCLNCVHCFEVPIRGPVTVGQKSYVCKFGPPIPVLIPTANGAAISPMQPPVNADTWCAQHYSKELKELSDNH